MPRDPEWRRAAEHVKEVYKQRPEMDWAEWADISERVSTRYLGEGRAVGWLTLLTGVAAVVANDGRWYFHVLGGLFVVLGLGTALVGPRMERNVRREEIARIRKHGLDVYDSLIERDVWVFAYRSTALVAVCELAVAFALLSEAWLVWDRGVVARCAAVVAVAAYAATMIVPRWSGRRGTLRWKRDFLREEGLELPPVPPELQVLLGRAST